MAQGQARSQAVVNYTEATRGTLEATRRFSADVDQFTPQLEQVLPDNVSVDRFKRTLVTAVATNPDLLYADRRTLFNSSLKAATDGLLPDGKEAALVIFNTDVKMRNPNTGLDETFKIAAVSYIPMLAGLKKRMRNSGEVLSIAAEVVRAKDKFAYGLGDNAYINHDPPPLGTDRGDIIGAYAIIRLRNGEVIRDVMDVKRIELARNQSRQKDGLMWSKFYDEGCCKTVLKHAAKDAPQSAELVRILYRDEEPEGAVLAPVPGMPELAAPTPAPAAPEPEPPPPVIEPDPEPTHSIITLDGEELSFRTVSATVTALKMIFEEAAKRGPDALDGAYESNDRTINEDIGKEAGDELNRLYRELSVHAYHQKPATAPVQPPEPPAATTPAAPSAPPPTAPAATVTAATSTGASPGPSSTGDVVPFPGDVIEPPPPPPAEPEGAGSWHFPPVMRNGKYDWRAWVVGIFIPKVRRIDDSTDMALCLGDNDENLKRARLALHEADRQTLEQAIEQKWAELG
jgi:recombination protein RecT